MPQYPGTSIPTEQLTKLKRFSAQQHVKDGGEEFDVNKIVLYLVKHGHLLVCHPLL